MIIQLLDMIKEKDLDKRLGMLQTLLKNEDKQQKLVAMQKDIQNPVLGQLLSYRQLILFTITLAQKFGKGKERIQSKIDDLDLQTLLVKLRNKYQQGLSQKTIEQINLSVQRLPKKGSETISRPRA